MDTMNKYLAIIIFLFACRPFGDFEDLDIPDSAWDKYYELKDSSGASESVSLYKCIEEEVYLVKVTSSSEYNHDEYIWYYNRHGSLMGTSEAYSDVSSWVEEPPVDVYPSECIYVQGSND